MGLRDRFLRRKCHICKTQCDKNAGSRLPAGRYDTEGTTYTVTVGFWVCESCQKQLATRRAKR